MTVTSKRIPLMRPKLPDAAQLMPYLREIDGNRWYTNFGPLEQRLTARLAARFGVPDGNVACLTNATTALSVSLSALTGGNGQYCLLPSFTFVATAHAVEAAGLTPYFLDIDPVTWRLDTGLVRDAIDRLGPAVGAVVVVAPFGAPLEIRPWDHLTEQTGVPVVVDAAAGFDSVAPGVSPTIISLHATKPLAAGEGGLVISRDGDHVAEVKARANFGFHGRRRADGPGMNAKLGEYAAAVALASLDQWPEKRAELARVTAAYVAELSGIPALRLSPGFGDGWVSATCNVSFGAPVADIVIATLEAAGIEARLWWNKGCHREPAFFDAAHDPLPTTEDLVERVVGLPFGEDLEPADIRRIGAALRTVSAG